MSNTSSPPLRLELKSSRWLDAAVLALTPLAMLAILRSGLPGLAVIVVPLLTWSSRSVLRCCSATSLLFRADGSVARLLQNDEEIALEPSAFFERGPFAALVLVEGGRRWRIPCGPDTLDATARRDLRLWFARHVRTDRPRREPAHV